MQKRVERHSFLSFIDDYYKGEYKRIGFGDPHVGCLFMDTFFPGVHDFDVVSIEDDTEILELIDTRYVQPT